MQKIKYKKQKLIILFVYLLTVVSFYYFDLPCVFKEIFKFECLGCGMTRAWISAMQFDFISAFKYHPMFWSIPFVLVYLIFDGKLFKNKKINDIILTLIAICFLINWLFKIF